MDVMITDTVSSSPDMKHFILWQYHNIMTDVIS